MKETRDFIKSKLINIPFWINTNSSTHYATWNVMMDCNHILLTLITTTIFRTKKIDNMVFDFNNQLDVIFEILDEHLELELVTYYATLLNLLITSCLEDEQYEAAENVKNFKNTFYDKINDEDEEPATS